MRIKGFGASRRLRRGVFSLIAVVAAFSVTTDVADARSKKKEPARPAAAKAAPAKATVAETYSPRYADIVVDANSGGVLQSTAADSPRHPASLTKIMTLYMLFERLESGEMKLNTELPVSARASAQAPSKLGLKPGQTIQVEDAIKAIVTRSANDVAVVIAEAISGSEDSFAKAMTGKARGIGMNRTVYMNASGLPDDAQITTARDQALLGRVIQERFPKYYKYFSTTRFTFRGNSISSHNRLLGKVTGVDGIKTGFINASGFNLVTSMKRNNRHLVAVVLGGYSASARDARMRELLENYVRVASVKQPVLAQAKEPAAPSPAQRIAAAVISPAKADPAPTSAIPVPRSAPAAVPGSDDPLQPISVKTVSVKAAPTKIATLGGQSPVPPADIAHTEAGPELGYAETRPPAPQPGVLGVLPVRVASAAPGAHIAPTAIPAAAPAEPHRSGWMIQIGAFDQEKEAKQRLASAQSRAKSLLGIANGFTERVTKGDKTLYRARFAGLDKDQADAVCQYLKKNDIACLTLKN